MGRLQPTTGDVEMLRDFPPEILARYRSYLHIPEGYRGKASDRRFEPGNRVLVVTLSMDDYELSDAFINHLGIRTWRHLSVQVAGALDERLKDQQTLGRQRNGGERSPAPLPDWYELTHLAYDPSHRQVFQFNPNAAVYQYLPPPGEDKLNIAESLHLRQPA